MLLFHSVLFFFFFNDTATTEIYTLSLHDALPIPPAHAAMPRRTGCSRRPRGSAGDRKSTRLNSSHDPISYAVFCLKKKKNKTQSSNKETKKKRSTKNNYDQNRR